MHTELQNLNVFFYSVNMKTELMFFSSFQVFCVHTSELYYIAISKHSKFIINFYYLNTLSKLFFSNGPPDSFPVRIELAPGDCRGVIGVE